MNDISDIKYRKTERLIEIAADSQSFINIKDKLSLLVEKYLHDFSQELDECELDLVVAAAKPKVPKYKMMEKNM